MPNNEELQALHIAYKNCFNTVDGEIVLADLKKQCFFNESTYRGDVNEMLRNEGQRRVLLRIINWSDPRRNDKQNEIKEKQGRTK